MKSGGYYLLDVPNGSGIYRHFKPEVVSQFDTSIGEIILRRVSTMDLKTGRMNKVWTYYQDSKPIKEHTTSVRIYQSYELFGFLKEAGFVDIHLMGDLAGTELEMDHLQAICIGRKP